jgi:hypothetical protein
VVHVRPEGTKRLVTLRRADLDSRFPGFLDSIVATTRHLPLVCREGEVSSGEQAAVALA